MYRIEVPSNIITKSINGALKKPSNTREDFFYELRVEFRKNLEGLFKDNGLQINTDETLGNTNYLKHGTHKEWKKDSIVKYTGWNNDREVIINLETCAKYGHGDYSLKAINYIDRAPLSLPSLNSLLNVFSIGNILVLVENKDCKVDLSLGNGVHATGFAYHISKRKKKSYFCLFGIWFEPKLINPTIEKILSEYKNKPPTPSDLDEIRLGSVIFPMLWVHRITGKLFTCTCFQHLFSLNDDINRFLPFGGNNIGLNKRFRNLKYLKGLCHYCSGGIPKHQYGDEMYYSSFLQKYLPYHHLLARKQHGKSIYEGKEFKVIENELREKFSFPKIGEGWVSETLLYNMIVKLFPNLKVIHHYRGSELQKLELDIWLPEIKVGIEYQGEQHYQAIKHWGGLEGLNKRKLNDSKKKMLCAQLGYTLIEFKFSEDITEELVLTRMASFISTN